MKKLTHLFLTAFTAISLISISVFANDDVTDAEIYRFLDKSGATRAVEGIPMQIQAMGQQMALTAKDPQEHQQFMQVMLSSLDVDQMQVQLLESVRKSVTSQDIKNIMVWLDSDLGERIVAAELKSADPAFQQNLMQYMAGLQSNPPTPERTQAVISYVENSNIAQQSMKMVKGIVGNMFNAAKALKPEDKEMAKHLDASLEQMLVTMKPALEQQMILTSYFIYQELSIEELNQYSNFYAQPVGQQYMSLIIDGVSDAMGTWGETLMSKIIELEKTSELN